MNQKIVPADHCANPEPILSSVGLLPIHPCCDCPSTRAWYACPVTLSVYNKNAGKASGGAEFAFTLATVQLMVGSVYAIFLWAAPDARKAPKMTFDQVLKLAPLGFWAAVAHAGAVYAMTAGAVSFGQIVKAGEPVFACIVGYLAYNSKVSMAKLLCLVPVIGGIAIASAKVRAEHTARPQGHIGAAGSPFVACAPAQSAAGAPWVLGVVLRVALRRWRRRRRSPLAIGSPHPLRLSTSPRPPTPPPATPHGNPGNPGNPH